MTYTTLPHVNSMRSIRKGLVRRDHKTGKIIPHVTYQCFRAEERAIDIKRRDRQIKKLLNPEPVIL